MVTEKEINALCWVMAKYLNPHCGSTCNTHCESKRICHIRAFAEELIEAGYGNVKQAVKEFADIVLKELDSIEEHCFDMHNWQGQSAVCECMARLKDKFKELYGKEANK